MGSLTYTGPRPLAQRGSPAPSGSSLVDGTLFGQEVRGLRPEFLDRLRTAEHQATSAESGSSGVDTIVGYRRGSRSHSHGLAVDINYFANPYLMHESGEEALDARLGPVYHRIARLILGRDSVIPEAITQGAPSRERALRLYGSLADESRAMIAYFRLMQDRKELARSLEGGQLHSAPADSPESLQRQMMADYVELSGRAGPPVGELPYPPAAEVPGADRPFSGDPRYRGPEFGFLDLPEPLLTALLDAGIRWGATDMGPASGDVMHFYLPAAELGKPGPPHLDKEQD